MSFEKYHKNMLFVLCLLSCIAGCSRTTPVIVPGDTVDVTTETVDDGGGVITVTSDDELINGMSIDVPAGAFSESQTLKISYRQVTNHNLPAGAQLLTPLVSVDNGNSRAGDFVAVSLPAAVPDDHEAMVFYYDEAGNRLEGMTVVASGGDGITFLTRHFSDFVAVAVPKAKLLGFIDSEFKPGIDDWQFANYGSWVAPNGHCAGQSIMALYYYTEKKLKEGAPPLFGRYDNDGNIYHKTPDLQYDDVLAYKLCSVAQNVLGANVAVDDLSWHDRQHSDLATFNMFSQAILISGEPQFATIYRTTAQGKREGHAMIVYKESRRTNSQGLEEGVLHVADPNYPGEEREILYSFAKGAFEPYSSGSDADNLGDQFPEIYFKEKRDLFDPALDGTYLWDQLEDATIGDGEFPEYALYLERSSESGASGERVRIGELTDSYAVSGPSGVDYFIEAESDAIEDVYSAKFREDGTEYGTAAFRLSPGLNRIGVRVNGGKYTTDSDGNRNYSLEYVGFRWVNITFTPADDTTTTTTAAESTTTTTAGTDLSVYNCAYLELNAVSLCSEADYGNIYRALNPSWGGGDPDGLYPCPPQGYGTYADGEFTVSADYDDQCFSVHEDISVIFNFEDGLSIDSLVATKEKKPADGQDCFGVTSESVEITVSGISCSETADGVACSINGGDVAGAVDLFLKSQIESNGDKNECSTLYNDYTLMENEFYHDRTPSLNFYLRKTQ